MILIDKLAPKDLMFISGAIILLVSFIETTYSPLLEHFPILGFVIIEMDR